MKLLFITLMVLVSTLLYAQETVKFHVYKSELYNTDTQERLAEFNDINMTVTFTEKYMATDTGLKFWFGNKSYSEEDVMCISAHDNDFIKCIICVTGVEELRALISIAYEDGTIIYYAYPVK